MAVNKNIPQAGDMLAISQLDILNNNIGYVDTFAVDHTDYNSVTPGFHSKVTFPGITPDPVTTGATGVIFGKVTSDATPRMDAYYKYQTAAGSSMSGLSFPVNFVKASAKLVVGGANFVANTDFNIASVTTAANTYIVTLTSAFTDNLSKMMVFVSTGTAAFSSTAVTSYNIVSTTEIHVFVSASSTQVSFVACSLGW